MYLTYEEYQSYGGTLDETTFNDYEFEAEVLIDWYTFNRLQKEDAVPERVKRCVNKLIDLAKLKADMLIMGKRVVSQTVDGVTTTTETSGNIIAQTNDGVSIQYSELRASELFNLLNGGNEFQPGIISDTINKYLYGVTNSLGQRVLYRGIYPNE